MGNTRKAHHNEIATPVEDKDANSGKLWKILQGLSWTEQLSSPIILLFKIKPIIGWKSYVYTNVGRIALIF